jgi:hypothetical protein
MSDSDDADWASDSDDEEATGGKAEGEQAKKDALSFAQIDALGLLVEAAKGATAAGACKQGLTRRRRE